VTCRTVGYTSCTTNTPLGQQLTYDTLGELTAWRDDITSASASYAYDGEGRRVYQQAVSTDGPTTTTTTITYVFGGSEEVTNTLVTGQQATSTASRNYALPSGLLAVRDANPKSRTHARYSLGSTIHPTKSTQASRCRMACSCAREQSDPTLRG
jgi:hypothetical protein